MTEEERERARRDAVTEASNLKADLIYREHKEREKRRKVTGKGHAAQSAAKQCRAETFRRDAKELRAKDTNKSKSALAAQLSRLYKKDGIKYGTSVSAILRAAGDLLEKKRPE